MPAADQMERGYNMRKIAVAVMLLLLLAGCSKMKPESSGDSADSLSGNSSESVSVSQPASDSSSQAENLSEIPGKPDPVPEPADPASQTAEGSGTESTDEVESNGQQETFNAAEAVRVEQVDGGIKVVFEQMPETAGDLQALMTLYSQSDARNVGAYFVASLVRYVDSTEDGLAMIDLLRGPRPMNDMDKNFIRDRLRDKAYLPGAYFQGAAPENNYTPDTPWTLMVYDDLMEAEEGYIYIQVSTTGADSRRRITLREKDGQYYLWEYSNVLTGIRLPASEDPWL